MALRPDHRRPPIDYDLQRNIAAQLRAEMMNDIVSKTRSAIAPSRRTSVAIILVVLVGAGGFWTVLLRHPPVTAAQAVPSAQAQASPR